MLIAMLLSYLGWDQPLQVLRVVEPVPPVINLVRPQAREDSELDAPSSRRRGSETADSRRRGESSDRDRDDLPKIVDDLFGIGESFFRPSDKKEKETRPSSNNSGRRDVAGFIDEILPPTRRK
jgi:hypothetical protein